VPRINAEGASVGGWLTRVEAAEVYTYGLGGDSYIQANPKEHKILVGPNRVWPLSYIVSKYPYLKKELERGIKVKRDLLFNQRSDCYVFLKEPKTNGTKLSKTENDIIELLKEGPHYIYYIAEKLNSDVNTLPLSKMEQMGLIIRSSITPTDLLHVTGELNQLDKEGALLGVQLLADSMKMSREDFVEQAMDEIINKLCLTIMQSLVKVEGRDVWIENNKGSMVFLDKILKSGKKNEFNCSVSMEHTLVGIGAPVGAYLPKVAERIDCRLVVPTNAEVANAVGAATGKVIDTTKVLIKPGSEGGFIVHLPWERKTFMELDEATDFAMKEAKEYARKNALRSGAVEPELMVDKKEIYSKSVVNWGDDVYIETKISVTAVGKPKW
jgi:N-methylhydantoinase A/oxoprolinase/acetone carboxylase beta subunit